MIVSGVNFNEQRFVKNFYEKNFSFMMLVFFFAFDFSINWLQLKITVKKCCIVGFEQKKSEEFLEPLYRIFVWLMKAKNYLISRLTICMIIFNVRETISIMSLHSSSMTCTIIFWFFVGFYVGNPLNSDTLNSNLISVWEKISWSSQRFYTTLWIWMQYPKNEKWDLFFWVIKRDLIKYFYLIAF